MNQQHVKHRTHQRNGSQILVRIVIELGIQMRAQRNHGRTQHEGVAVLSEQRHDFQDVRVAQILAMRKYAYFDPLTVDHVRHVSLFYGGASREVEAKPARRRGE